MADVFLAEDTALARLVAVKVLHRDLARDAQYVERFRREAQAAAALGHPNIVAIHDRGTSEDVPFIVMEYVRGETLKERIRRSGRIRPDEAVEITLQLLVGLRFAHERHIVHRDVKAQNVLIDGPAGKIVDFGIARVGTPLTDTGTHGHGAVRLARAGQGRPPTNVPTLLLGVILHEMLSGRLRSRPRATSLWRSSQRAPPGRPPSASRTWPVGDRITATALALRREERAAGGGVRVRRVVCAGTGNSLVRSWRGGAAGAAEPTRVGARR
jgi:serine/threonine-protein kinase